MAASPEGPRWPPNTQGLPRPPALQRQTRSSPSSPLSVQSPTTKTPASPLSTSFKEGRDGEEPRRSNVMLLSISFPLKGRGTCLGDTWEVSPLCYRAPLEWASVQGQEELIPDQEISRGHKQRMRLNDSPACQQPEPHQILLPGTAVFLELGAFRRSRKTA